MGLKKLLILQKYRFDLAVAFLSLINFGLLVLSNSERLENWFGLKSTPLVILLFILSAFFMVWLMGFLLDKIRYPHEKFVVEFSRNPIIMETLERVKGIEKKLEKQK